MPALSVHQSSGFAAHFLGQLKMLAMRLACFVFHTVLTAPIASTCAVLYALVFEKAVCVASAILPGFIMKAYSTFYQRFFSTLGRDVSGVQYRGRQLKLEAEMRNRSDNVTHERRNAVLAVDSVLKSTGRFKLKYPDDPTVDLVGSRMQKYWMVVEPGDQWPSLVLTTAPISRRCPLLETNEKTGEKTLTKETVKTLNELIGILQVHPYIHPLVNMNSGKPVWVYYLRERKQWIMVQDNARSLKDIIYKEEFTERGKDWAEKYHQTQPKETLGSLHHHVVHFVTRVASKSILFAWDLVRAVPLMGTLLGALSGMLACLFDKRCRKLPAIPIDKVVLYGRQILEAMMFLYKQGFPVLGHVHSGNIFVQDGVCRLGGYENTLLGYRSRYYRMCQDHLEHIDVIMFGHLVFEMCCGYELKGLSPTLQDYQAVRSVEGGERVEEVLRCIFTKGFPHGIEHIIDLPFFQTGMLSSPFNETKIQVSSEMVSLLARVRGDIDGQGKHQIVP